MGKTGGWFAAVKKVLSPDAKEKKSQKILKSKGKWFGKSFNLSSSAETPLPLPAPSSPSEKVKLSEAENQQSKHAYSVALATAAAAQAAVAAAQAAAEIVRLTTTPRFSGKSKEEEAAIKIQTAFRGHMARRAARSLRGLVRLKSLMQGQSVQRQATNTLRCMQTLARVQSQICTRRLRMSEENQALQRQLQQKHELDLDKLSVSMNEEWNDSPQSREQMEAKFQSKQEAAIRRERALAYSFSHQKRWKPTSKSAHPSFMDSNNPQWGWSWLERWMAARPWENQNATNKDLQSDRASLKSSTSHAISLGEINKPYAHSNLNPENKSSPTAQKACHRPNFKTPSTPPSKAPSSCSVIGKMKVGSPRGGGRGRDDDARSILGTQSGHHRRHSTGCSMRDDESLACSTGVPSYMAPTRSAKSRSHFPSPAGVENKTSETVLPGSAKKRLSFSPTFVGPRRCSVPPKLGGSSAKEMTK